MSMQGGMWIPGDFLVSPRKLAAVLATEARANGWICCCDIFCSYFSIVFRQT